MPIDKMVKTNNTFPDDIMETTSDALPTNDVLHEPAIDTGNIGVRKVEKKLPASFKEDLEGYRMTAAWARKLLNKYGGNKQRLH